RTGGHHRAARVVGLEHDLGCARSTQVGHAFDQALDHVQHVVVVVVVQDHRPRRQDGLLLGGVGLLFVAGGRFRGCHVRTPAPPVEPYALLACLAAGCSIAHGQLANATVWSAWPTLSDTGCWLSRSARRPWPTRWLGCRVSEPQPTASSCDWICSRSRS